MIVGIDLSSRKVAAVALDRVEDDLFHKALIFSEEAPKASRAQVCATFQRWAEKMFSDLPKASSVWIEEPIVSKRAGPKVTIGQAQIDGVLQSAAVRAEITWVYSVHHMRWKAEIVGRGNASKKDIANWVEREHPDFFADADGDQDVLDAFCIALYGSRILSRAGSITR